MDAVQKLDCPFCSLFSINENDPYQDIDVALMRILAMEIHLDGGISYLNMLREHSSSSLISSLLKRYSPPMKLATFLEKYPSVFDVKRENEDCPDTDYRHTVSLLCDILKLCPPNKNQPCSFESKNIPKCLSSKFIHYMDDVTIVRDQASNQLKEKVQYILKRRNEKMKRRSARRSKHGPATEKLASIEWLAKQLEKELHRYSRLLGNGQRPKGVLMGSNEWWRIVVPIFVEFLEQNANECTQLHENKTLIDLISNNSNNSLNSTSEESPSKPEHSPMTNSKKELIASHLEKIFSAKQENLVNGIDYGLLLNRNEKLRQILNGQDLIQLIQSEQKCENPNFFDKIILIPHIIGSNEDCHNVRNWRIGLDHRRISTKLKKGETDAPNEIAGNEIYLDNIHSSRPETDDDDIGLFSVTGSKVAVIMAKSLSHALQDLMRITNKNKDYPSDTVCIDLTAGVGGNTIPCAKHFSYVTAYEIDQKRASLCQQNVLKRLGVNALAENTNISVKCENGLSGLPILAKRFGRSLSSSPDSVKLDRQSFSNIAIILDPPWGGLNYRQFSEEIDHGLGLIGIDGESHIPLSEVVEQISLHMAPTVLGIKLPLTFEVNSFMQHLNRSEGENMRDIKAVSIKKMKRQLFLILRIL